MEKSAFERACDLTGGLTKLAAAIGRSKQAINHYKDRVPPEMCPPIERATGGKVTCEQLRLDIAWHRVADKKWPWHPKGRPTLDVTQPVLAKA